MKYFIIICFFFCCSCDNSFKIFPISSLEVSVKNYSQHRGYIDLDEGSFFYNDSKINNVVYKYYIDGATQKVDSFSVLEFNPRGGGNFFVNFDQQNLVVLFPKFRDDVVFNSKLNKIIYLDSLNILKPNGRFFLFFNENTVYNNKLLLDHQTNGTLKSPNEFKSDIDYYRYMAIEANTFPSFAILDMEKNELKYSNLNYAELRPELDISYDEVPFRPSAIFMNDKILFSNGFGNLLAICNLDGTLKKKIKIESKYTNFSNDFYDFSKSKESYTEFVNRKIDYATRVSKVIYDKYRKKVLLVILHEVDSQANSFSKGYSRPFSILVYDEEFNLENEFFFQNSDYKYNPRYIYISKNGFVIDSNNEFNNKYESKKNKYEIFNY